MFYRLEKKGGGQPIPHPHPSSLGEIKWTMCTVYLKESDNGSLSVQRKMFAILLWEAEKSARKIMASNKISESPVHGKPIYFDSVITIQ